MASLASWIWYVLLVNVINMPSFYYHSTLSKLFFSIKSEEQLSLYFEQKSESIFSFNGIASIEFNSLVSTKNLRPAISFSLFNFADISIFCLIHSNYGWSSFLLLFSFLYFSPTMSPASVLVNVSSYNVDFERCESVVQKWAFSSLEEEVKDDKHTLRDLLFFLHVPRTGGRTYFHW